MLFRLLRYMVRIWERWWKAHPDAQRLPLLIPIVLYHGAERWSAPLAFEEMVEINEEIAESALPFIPHFQCVLDDLSHHTTEDLRARSLTALGRLVLHLFKNGRQDPHFVDRLGDWADTFRKVWTAPDGLATLEAVIRYILQVRNDATPARMRAILGASVAKSRRRSS